MKKKFVLLAVLTSGLSAFGQSFDKYFENATLRLDYIFAGTDKTQEIYVDELVAFPEWAGRRHHLKELPLQGNGQITVCDKVTGDTLYRHSFSSLFQEWQATEEAVKVKKSFENTFLVPFPKRPVWVNVTLMDSHRKPQVSMRHLVDPKDILIRQINATGNVPYRYIVKEGNPENCIVIAMCRILILLWGD